MYWKIHYAIEAAVSRDKADVSHPLTYRPYILLLLLLPPQKKNKKKNPAPPPSSPQPALVNFAIFPLLLP